MYVTLLRDIERYKNYPTDPNRSAVFNKTKPKCTTVECSKSQFYDQCSRQQVRESCWERKHQVGHLLPRWVQEAAQRCPDPQRGESAGGGALHVSAPLQQQDTHWGKKKTRSNKSLLHPLCLEKTRVISGSIDYFQPWKLTTELPRDKQIKDPYQGFTKHAVTL